jgi:hypothetical protein
MQSSIYCSKHLRKMKNKTYFQLNIPTPCHERWEDFTPTNTGGFCGACQKNVIDFTKMTDSELVAYFRDLNHTNGQSCGRFRSDQLGKDFDVNAWFPDWNFSDTILNYEIPLSDFSNASKTIKLPAIKGMKIVRNLTMAMLTFVWVEQGMAQQRQIKGQVTDSEGVPLIGTSVSVKGTKRGVNTDKDGKYQLVVEEKDVLIFSFVGFKSEEQKVGNITPVVQMQEDVMGLSGVVVLGYETMGKMGMKTGGLRAEHWNSSDPQFRETNFQKSPTQIIALDNPTVKETIMIVAKIHEETVFNSPEEKILAENWYTANAFQHIEEVQVYDLMGRVFKTDFYKLNDGKIVVNIKNVPNETMCIVRVTYSNEHSINAIEHDAVKVMVKK